MIFESYYLECLSQASYLVADESTKRAAIIDPQRDIDLYLDDLKAQGLTLEYIFETHIHADFLSGHLELSKATGAKIVFGADAKGRLEFESIFAKDGDLFSLNDDGVHIGIIETPGHTPESITIAVFENPPTNFEEVNYGEPKLLFTGDTLFIGDVGRPDLLGSVGLSSEEMAKQLYASLRNKILLLPDETLIYPAHGAGSACGKSLSAERSSSLGEQRKNNYALAPMSEQEFIDLVTEGQPLTPQYFSHSVEMNKSAHTLLDEDQRMKALSLEEAIKARDDGAVILDVRSPTDFSLGHIKGSINIGLDGRFAETAGQVLSPDTKIILAGEHEHNVEARMRLARIGYDNTLGEIKDFYDTLENNESYIDFSKRIDAVKFRDSTKLEKENLQVIDVRTISEVEDGTIDSSTNIPLARLHERYQQLDSNKPVIVFCAGGWRSSVASSFLRSKGFKDVSDVIGGYNALKLATN